MGIVQNLFWDPRNFFAGLDSVFKDRGECFSHSGSVILVVSVGVSTTFLRCFSACGQGPSTRIHAQANDLATPLAQASGLVSRELLSRGERLYGPALRMAQGKLLEATTFRRCTATRDIIYLITYSPNESFLRRAFLRWIGCRWCFCRGLWLIQPSARVTEVAFDRIA
jgi:hypothetical protein